MGDAGGLSITVHIFYLDKVNLQAFPTKIHVYSKSI